MDCIVCGVTNSQTQLSDFHSPYLKLTQHCKSTILQRYFFLNLERRDRFPTPVFLGFPCGSAGKESACNAGDLGWEDPLEKGKATHSSILA